MNDGQFELAGVLMGRGTNYPTSTIEGLAIPLLRDFDVEKSYHHGAFQQARDLLPVRRVIMSLGFSAMTDADLKTKLDTLAKAWAPTIAPVLLKFQRPGRPQMRLSGRPRRLEYGHDPAAMMRIINAVAQFDAGDPVIYTDAESQATGSIPAGSSSSGNIAATGGGTFPTRPTLTITGPATNPRIQNSTDANKQIKVDVALAAGDTLVIDVAARTVKINGADSYQYVRSDNQWWDLLVGANTIVYSRTGTTGVSNITIAWRDGWISV